MNYSQQSNAKRRKEHMSAAKKAKNKISIYIFRIIMAFVLIGGFSFAGACFGAYFGIIEKAPILDDIPAFEGSFTSIIYDSNGVEIDRLDSGESREYATMAQIPAAMKYAFVALEDERFYNHDGVDFKGFARGVYETLTSDQAQGGSTITQQLIKNKLKIKRNTIETKLQEQYLAINYEKNLTEALGSKEAAKEHILELYMNVIGLGNGQNGVQAAALFYFGKDVSELTIAECAVIAATTQSPVAKNPIKYPEENRKRQEVAIANMLEFGYITQKEHDEALAEDVYSKIQEVKQVKSEKSSYHSYFVDQVYDEVSKALQDRYSISPSEASYMIYNGGLKIYTTQDTKIQKIVDEAYMDEESFPKKEFEIAITYEVDIRNTLTKKQKHFTEEGTVTSWDEVEAFVQSKQDKLLGTDDEIVADATYAIPQPQSGMVILDYHTGHVAAIAGGRGVKLTNRAFNRATNAERQPGSVFKVLASYAPAIDLGYITPATVIDDTPVTFEGTQGAPDWTPKNWWGSSFRGLSTIRQGITNSMNIVTAKNMYNTGVENCFDYLRNFGITTLSDKDGLATSLGGITYGVTQLEVTAAYGAIANEGVLVKPVFFTKVLDNNDNILLESDPQPKQVLKKTSSFLLTNMMQDVITSGTGKNARFKEVKMPIAGKTGTTSESKDLMFVGYTPYYVAGIYIGYDQPETVKDSSGPHLLLWSKIMEQIHQDLEYKEFPQAEGITTARICTVSGKLAVDGLCDHDPRGSRIRSEYFATGTVPSDYCDVHRRYQIDISTNQAPTIYSLPESVEERVGIVRPIPYYGSAAVEDRQYEVPASVLSGQSGGYGTGDPLISDDPVIDEPINEPINGPINGPLMPTYPMQNNNIGTTYHFQPTPTPVPTPTPTPVTAPVSTPATQNNLTNSAASPQATQRPLSIDIP